MSIATAPLIELSEEDFELIYQQCVNQSATSPRQIAGFASAYAIAKHLAVHDAVALRLYTPSEWYELFMYLAILIEPQNAKGYRCIPVTFAHMGSAARPEVITRIMDMLFEGISELAVSADEFYKDCQYAHPLLDGNGRVGDLMWKILKTLETGSWPQSLPPQYVSFQ